VTSGLLPVGVSPRAAKPSAVGPRFGFLAEIASTARLRWHSDHEAVGLRRDLHLPERPGAGALAAFGARWALTFIGSDNVPSLRGATSVGFMPQVRRVQ